MTPNKDKNEAELKRLENMVFFILMGAFFSLCVWTLFR